MKGTLLKDGDNWIVEHWVGLKVFEYPIHPTYEKYYFLNDDDNVKEVEFEVVKENVDTGALEAPYIKIEYAKLIKYKMEEPLQFLATQAQELGLGYDTPSPGKIKKLTEEEWVELNNAVPRKIKTALQELWEDIHSESLKEFSYYMEIEERQIIEACKYGNRMYKNFEPVEVTGKDYYDKTFRQDKTDKQ